MRWDRTKGRPEPIRALNRVKEVENGEPLVELAVAAPEVVVMRPSVIPYLRQTVAQMLAQAARNLPSGQKLGVVDAWRPFARQLRIYEWMKANLEAARPGLSHAAQRRVLCRFVAPTDQKAPPGHTTGAAVDVHLLDAKGDVLDTSAPFPRLLGAPTYVYGLTEEAQRNRDLLVGTMLGVGFSNCRDEWWHYSWGDAGWAVREGLDTCCYGRVDMPEHVYAEKMDAWERLVKNRGNPFLGEW